MFDPKVVLSRREWLTTMRDRVQTLDDFQCGGDFVNYLDFDRNSKTPSQGILMIVLDNDIESKHAKKFRKYVEAFFDNVPVWLIRAG